MSSGCRAWVNAEFSRAHSLAQIQQLYRDLLERT